MGYRTFPVDTAANGYGIKDVGPGVCEDCPLRMTQEVPTPSHQEDRRAVTFHDDGAIVYVSQDAERECGVSRVKAASPNYEIAKEAIDRCQGPEKNRVCKPGLMGKLGLATYIKYDCPAVETFFDPTSPEQVSNFFEAR